MPSKTPKQKRTMAAAAHDPKFAAKLGIPVKVAKEFNRSDVGSGSKSRYPAPAKLPQLPQLYGRKGRK